MKDEFSFSCKLGEKERSLKVSNRGFDGG